MDLVKLLRSLEELTVEIALWIIFLPRTFWAVIVTPVSLAQYFDRIQATPEKERDEQYLSPVLFWLLLAPVSLVAMLMKQDEKTLSLYGASFSERLATAVFMLMGIPLGFALVSTWFRCESISKNHLGREFALQCYYNAPLALSLVICIGAQKRFGEDVATIPFAIAMVWFLITEVRVARRNSSIANSIGMAGLGCLAGAILMFAVGFVVACVFLLIGRLTTLW